MIFLKKEENRSLFESIFKKVSYSTGFICAKAAKLKNEATAFFENAKDGLVDIRKSFQKGFKPVKKKVVNEAKEEAEDKLKGIEHNPNVEKPETKVRLKSLEQGDRHREENQRIKRLPEEMLDADFEKEIDEIDRRLAEV